MSKKSLEVVLSELKELLLKDARDPKTNNGDFILNWQEFQAASKMYVRLALNKDVDNQKVSALYKAGKERGLWDCTKPNPDNQSAIFIHTRPREKREDVDVEAIVNSLL